MKTVWQGRALQFAARYGEQAPMATTCCNACRTCTTTNLLAFATGMTYGPVGIRCPDHATTGGKTVAPRRAARSASRRLDLYGPFITISLIAINVGVYVLQLLTGAGLSANSGWIYEHGVLFGPAVADGDWWRLITAPFLHYGIIHLGLNMRASG